MITIDRNVFTESPDMTDGNESRRMLRRQRAEAIYSASITIGGAIVVGLVVGGIIASILQLLAPKAQWPMLIGLCAAPCIAGVLILRCAADRALSMTVRRPPSTKASPIDAIRIDNIETVMHVDDLEDFGPGYLIETLEGERVFFAGEELSEIDNEGEELSETVALYVYADTPVLFDAKCEGSRVEVSGICSIQDLGIDPETEFAILQTRK